MNTSRKIPEGATHTGRSGKDYYKVVDIGVYRWRGEWVFAGYAVHYCLAELTLRDIMEDYINSE